MKKENLNCFGELENYECMHQLSLAYLDCAIELCSRMKSGCFSATFSRGQAALYLGYHSVELFLKAAILQKKGSFGKHHDLRKLREEYEKAFPEKEFKIETPYWKAYVGFSEEKAGEMMEKEEPADQKFRYPTNKNNEQWWPKGCFDPQTCLSQLRKYRDDMVLMGEKMYGQKQSSLQKDKVK